MCNEKAYITQVTKADSGERGKIQSKFNVGKKFKKQEIKLTVFQ